MRTFIVRIFEPAPDAGTVALRGVVEDVRTGSSTAFHGESELLAVLRGLVRRLPDDRAPEVVGPHRTDGSYQGPAPDRRPVEGDQ
jgi:hypothetical protein